MWLFDTCSIINVSYCPVVAQVFKSRYSGRAGWVKAVHTELVSQRAGRRPHPQAGKALSWASTWLGAPIVLDDPADFEAIEEVRMAVAAGGGQSELDHLGEAASIAALLKNTQWTNGRLISDDLGARDEARLRGVPTRSTVGVVAALLAVDPAPLSAADADTYLNTLRARGRMHVQLTSKELLAEALDSWA